MEKRIIRIVLDAKDEVGKAFVKTERIIKETKATYTLREVSALRARDDEQYDYKLRKSGCLFDEITYRHSSYYKDYPTSAIYFGIIKNENADVAALVEGVITEMKQELVKRFEDHIKVIQSRLEVIGN